VTCNATVSNSGTEAWRKWPARVLEVGCGAGDLIARVASSGCEAVGVDSSPAAHGEAEARAGRCAGRLAVRPELPDGGAFDLVMAFEVLERVERGAFERITSLLSAEPLLLPFCWLQLAFLERDWGNGYLALARREA